MPKETAGQARRPKQTWQQILETVRQIATVQQAGQGAARKHPKG